MPISSRLGMQKKNDLSSPMPFQQEFWSHPQQTSAGIGGLANIKGFITALPINWTRDENLHFQYPTDLVAENIHKQSDTGPSAFITQSDKKITPTTTALIDKQADAT